MKKGFTLVELSIVLVIIGLLISGLLVGQSMIQATKVQATVKQFQQLEIAISNFTLLYKQLPGDSDRGFSNPGDNDGTTRDLLDGVYAFQHLQESGHIDYGLDFSSLPTDAADFSGVVIPNFGIDNAGVLFNSNQVYSTNFPYCKHGISLAGLQPPGTGTGNIHLKWRGAGTLGDVVLTNRMALAIDIKMDDGVPDTGNMIGAGASWGGGCGAAGAYPHYAAAYDTRTDVGCHLTWCFDPPL